MVYETDFYTTRRPYRASPSLSTYTITSEPSRQVRILPGLGKVHVVHTYDRIVPYVGHKRLNIVTSPPVVVRLRPSTLYREYDRIENKVRPFSYHSYTNDYLNSQSHVRIVYVRNPISSSYPVYRSTGLYTTRYYPTFGSYVYHPTYLNSYYYPNSLTAPRYQSTYNFYPSPRWLDLALYPSWRYNHYARMFDDETRNIRAQTASILQRIHDPVPRKVRSLPLPYVSRYESYDEKYGGAVCRYQDIPARLSNDHYINRMLQPSPSNKSQYTVYSSDPVRKFFGQGHLACVTLVGEKTHPRRRNVYVYQDPVRNDIQLLSYYINRFRDEKKTLPQTIKVILSASRPSRIFSVPRPIEGLDAEQSEEVQQIRQDRSARLAKIMVIDEETVKAEAAAKVAEERAKAAIKKEEVFKKASDRAAKKEESRSKKSLLATIEDELSGKTAKLEEDAAKKAEAEAKKAAEAAAKIAEAEAAKKAAEEAAQKEAEDAAKKQADEAEAEAKAKKDADAAAAKKKAEKEAARKEKEAKEAADKAAELERLAEQAKQEELAKQAEIEKAKKEEEDRARQEEEKRLAEAAKAEEEKQQLLRLEEIARQAEDEKEAELARQADELAELARQEAELAEQAKHEDDEAEQKRKEADHADIEKKEAELAELETKEKELVELAKQEAEIAEQARIEADQAKIEAENVASEEPIVEEPQTPEESASEPAQEPAVEVQE